MKKFLLSIIIAFLVFQVNAQQAVTWDFLSNVKWVKTYIESIKGYYEMPRFSTDIKAIAGKEISIKGFFIPVDASYTIFSISQNPSNMCFFCGGAGYASVIEIIPKKEKKSAFKRLKTDKYIEVKGTLSLNTTDQDHLMYVLKEAELVTVIK